MTFDIAAVVERYLAEGDMTRSRLDESTFALMFSGQNAETIAVYVQCAQDFIVLFTPLTLPIAQRRVEICKAMLRQCYTMNFVKAALDGADTPILQVEWPVASLNRDEFFMGVAALLRYADDWYPQLMSLIAGGPSRDEQAEGE